MKDCKMPDPGVTRALMTGIGQTNQAARQTGAARTMRVCQNVCPTEAAVAPPEIKECVDASSTMMTSASPSKVYATQRRTL